LFNPLAARAVKRATYYLTGELSVIEFGNQRLDPSLEGGTVQGFYKTLGFETYLALDVNTRMGAIVADLNDLEDVKRAVPFPAQYSLVTNNGTGEHIFNQKAVFEAAHWLCKPGGVMLHVLPFTPWINHGFYNYNPILFRDIAAANKYDTRFFWIGDRWASFHDCTGWPDLFVEKRPKQLENLIQNDAWKGDLFIVCAMTKVGTEPFRMPLQGKYVGDVEDAGLADQYSRKST
jgi:SAM-dependent methyltransferase